MTKVHATDVAGQTVVGNLTATNEAADGFVTVYPCSDGLPSPLTSNLNFRSGVDVANTVVTKTDSNGDVCFTPNVSTDLIWDQVAEVAAANLPAHNATRKIDTRNGRTTFGYTIVNQVGPHAISQANILEISCVADLRQNPIGTNQVPTRSLVIRLTGLRPNTSASAMDNNGGRVSYTFDDDRNPQSGNPETYRSFSPAGADRMGVVATGFSYSYGPSIDKTLLLSVQGALLLRYTTNDPYDNNTSDTIFRIDLACADNLG